MNTVLRPITLCVCLAGIAACHSIPTPQHRIAEPPSVNLQHTLIGERVNHLTQKQQGRDSGFLSLADGVDALAARIGLAERAEHSIDAQYYLVKSDIVGQVFIDSLLKAADRGVRVRLLVDDVFTLGMDNTMSVLNTHPHFEVRVFNPFQHGAVGRAWSGISQFKRVNRRMHTKSFTVDKRATIVGGRNIATEYFGASTSEDFGDFDVLGIGAVAQQASDMFAKFWDDPAARAWMPAESTSPYTSNESPLGIMRKTLRDNRFAATKSEYARALNGKLDMLFDPNADNLHWVDYRLVYDDPGKVRMSREEAAQGITKDIVDTLKTAETKAVLLSPYFVPRKQGIEFLTQLISKGVEVSVVTNSLAANNHAPVHAGYKRSRKPLLKAGAKLYEIRPDRVFSSNMSNDQSGSEIRATLHTKAFSVDEKAVFIGSYNFDPRSAVLNTESGLLLYSEEIAKTFNSYVQDGLPSHTFQVSLNNKGRLRWVDEEKTYKKEPQSSLWRRFTVMLSSLVPISGQL